MCIFNGYVTCFEPFLYASHSQKSEVVYLLMHFGIGLYGGWLDDFPPLSRSTKKKKRFLLVCQSANILAVGFGSDTVINWSVI